MCLSHPLARRIARASALLIAIHWGSLEITGVCPPSGINADPECYTENRSAIAHDQHGIGPFLLAGAAHLRANKTLKGPSGDQDVGPARQNAERGAERERLVVHMADVCVYGGTASGVMAAVSIDDLRKQRR